jgi:hypothetical protein
VRKLLVIITVASSLSLPVSSVEAHHRANVYCSRSGDICQSTAKVHGARMFRILLRARYFRWYHLCVTGHRVTVCTNFRIHRRNDGFFGDRVRWHREFPDYGPGPYTVTWALLSWERVGRKLGFHR